MSGSDDGSDDAAWQRWPLPCQYTEAACPYGQKRYYPAHVAAQWLAWAQEQSQASSDAGELDIPIAWPSKAELEADLADLELTDEWQARFEATAHRRAQRALASQPAHSPALSQQDTQVAAAAAAAADQYGDLPVAEERLLHAPAGGLVEPSDTAARRAAAVRLYGRAGAEAVEQAEAAANVAFDSVYAKHTWPLWPAAALAPLQP